MNILLKLLCCGLLLQMSACSPVSAWQRGNLAKNEMAVVPNPNLTSFRDHIFTSKEASQGRISGGGGGCGCN